MKFIKQFESFIKEELTAPSPTPTKPKPGIPTRPERPTRPETPKRPSEIPDKPERPEEEPTITPIETPVVDPDPMAHEVAKKFLNELEKKGIKPKKYKK